MQRAQLSMQPDDVPVGALSEMVQAMKWRKADLEKQRQHLDLTIAKIDQDLQEASKALVSKLELDKVHPQQMHEEGKAQEAEKDKDDWEDNWPYSVNLNKKLEAPPSTSSSEMAMPMSSIAARKKKWHEQQQKAVVVLKSNQDRFPAAPWPKTTSRQ